MINYQEILLILSGVVAGVIDAIAGGSGLVTLPVLSILIGPGATAVGTNKIAAGTSALVALIVYARKGHLRLNSNRLSISLFVFFVGFGAIGGALTAPLIPAAAYKWILLIICPVMLWIVYRKDLWIREESPHSNAFANKQKLVLWALGFGSGFYDGVAGPGGGTLMFLSLFLGAQMPLLVSLATAKLANVTSAYLALGTYAVSGHVIWTKGLWAAAGISVGAFIGANLATQYAGKIARLALFVVTTLLLIRLLYS